MMTLTFGSIAAGCFLLWRRKAQWSWALVMAALIAGIAIFIGDVDLGTRLGVQL
jgi:hypothetical protein